MRLLLGVLAACTLAACGDAVGPALLAGRWASAQVNLGSGYSREEFLNFRTNHQLDHRIRVYRSGRLESTSDYTYAYEVRNDSLFTAPMMTLDGTMPRWSFTPFNMGKLALDGSALRITYPWFGPADEPVTVTQVFLRAPCQPIARACF